jgi:hypothetical protein
VLVELFLVSALLLTHYWAMFLLAAMLLLSRRRGAPRPELRRNALRTGIALAAGGVFLLPWLSAMSYQSQHTGTPWAPAPRPTRVASETILDFTGGQFPESTLLAGVVVALVGLALLGRRVAGGGILLGKPAEDWRTHAAAVAIGTAAIGGTVAFVTGSAFAGRYASVYFPIVVLLLAAGIALIPSGWTRTGVFALLALLSAAVVLAQIHLYDRRRVSSPTPSTPRPPRRHRDRLLTSRTRAQAARRPPVCVSCHRPRRRATSTGSTTPIAWRRWIPRRREQVLAEAGDRHLARLGDGYRVVGDQCGQFAAHLIARRPGSVPLVCGQRQVLPVVLVIRLTTAAARDRLS